MMRIIEDEVEEDPDRKRGFAPQTSFAGCVERIYCLSLHQPEVFRFWRTENDFRFNMCINTRFS